MSYQYPELIPVTWREVIEAINQFCSIYVKAEWHLAHIVLSDYNLEDHSIDFCLETCFTDEWLNSCDFYNLPDNEEIEATRDFLLWLKSIPESIRLSEPEYYIYD